MLFNNTFDEELALLNQRVPYEDEFNAADTDKNGILVFKEWEEYLTKNI